MKLKRYVYVYVTTDVRLVDNSTYSVLVSLSCPKALYHLQNDNLFCITVVVDVWLG